MGWRLCAVIQVLLTVCLWGIAWVMYQCGHLGAMGFNLLGGIVTIVLLVLTIKDR